MMDWLNKLTDMLAKARQLSLAKRIILVIVVCLALCAALFGCTSTRSMSVSVDKAEKVDIHLTDSINGQFPTF